VTPPPPAGTATARKVLSASARPQVDRGAAPRRATLRPVPAALPRRQPPLRRLLKGRGLTALSIVLVVGSLLTVVVAQAMLASGQVQMAAVEHALTLEQSAHRQIELSDSALETPTRIVSVATGTLHMVHSAVIELPYVSLTTPLATPTVTPAPVATPPASGTTSPSSASSTSASTTSASTTPSTTTTASTP
jgi:hypothetical protein